MLRLFDLSLRLGGFPLAKARQELTHILAVPAEDFASHTEARKTAIAKFHIENNPFYSGLAVKFTRWSDLPVMQKSDFQRPLHERLSTGFSEKSVFINKTSGSSGNPMTFARDKHAHAMVWANIMRRFGWFGIDLNTSWQARFYGRTLDRIGGLKLQLKDFLSKRYRFDIFDLSDAALESVVSKFSRKKFSYINGYTSNIVMLAKYLRRRNIVLKEICPTLKVCITTSEMLLDDDRKVLVEWLGIPVVNEYGASELDIIAFEDLHGDWIINSETLFVEILDANNNPVADGNVGRIVVTALDNRAHPFIRYDVGDIGVIDPRSTPKHRILKKLVGRTNDFAVLPSGKKPAGMTFYSITKKLFDDDGRIREFTVTQTKLDTFEIDYVSDYDLNPDEVARMEKIMAEYLEPGLTFKFNRQHVLARGKSGKLRQFKSLIKTEA